MRKKPRNIVWAVRHGSYVELYDNDILDPDAVLVAEFFRTDFFRFFGWDLDEEGVLVPIRLSGRRV